ncbi:MAG: hypothetical protein ACT4PP_13155 [Sporichthyaceae bacterium]
MSASLTPQGVEVGRGVHPDAGVLAAHHLGEALEYVERARGHPYTLHQLIGHADGMLDQVLAELEAAGRADLACEVRSRIYGRDVLEGRWTFQVIEEFDDGYYAGWRSMTDQVRAECADGARHLREAGLKVERQQLS